MSGGGQGARKVVIGAVSVLSVLMAAAIGVKTAGLVAGTNVSDVGVAMYRHGRLAIVVGAAAYIVSVSALLILLSRAAGEHRRIPYIVGLPLSLCGLVLTVVLLHFAYG